MRQAAVTQRNTPKVTKRARLVLYFDPGRSRLFEGEDAFYDMSRLSDRLHAQFWCLSNGVEFYDHRIELHPGWLRPLLMKARAAGTSELREKKPGWCPVTFGVDNVWLPEMVQRPYASAHAKAGELPKAKTPHGESRRREKFWTSDDDGKTWYEC